MKKVYITFPQICVETAVIEVTDEQFEELIEHATEGEKAEFIWKNVPEIELIVKDNIVDTVYVYRKP